MVNQYTDSMECYRPPPLIKLANVALFLDVDGTILEFAPTPRAVSVPPLLRSLLKRLRDETRGAMALVSGREIAVLDELFKLTQFPVAGLHGLERRDATGHLHQHIGVGAALAPVAERLATFARTHPGIIMEYKKITLGLHYRAAPQHGAAVNELAESLEQSLPPELVLQRGKKVIEIRPAGADKGSAVNAFMVETPFSDRQPVFIGDDLTDEHAFEVINRRQGISIKVGHGVSLAHFRLTDPKDVRRWLWAVTHQSAGRHE
ncbi:MAG: trehalose-phosphatase [Porticoccaceae bacterium]